MVANSTGAEGLRQRGNATRKSSTVVITEQGREIDSRLDKHERYVSLTQSRRVQLKYLVSYEFGGPLGCIAIMAFFPCLMYYLWICLWFYDGNLVYPASQADIKPFFARIWGHIVKVSSQSFVSTNHSPMTRLRMPAPLPTRGKYILAMSRSSSSLHKFCPDTRSKVFPCRLLTIRPLCTTAMHSTLCM